MSRLQKLTPYLVLAVFFYLFVLAAWVGDDAYITLRTVDNFVNGYGLRWNVAERVQSFTHPLWLFSLLPVYFASRSPYFTVLFISFAFSLATLVVILAHVSFWRALPALAILLASKAFVDYSVSGLENPATHLFLALFFYQFFKQEDWNERDVLLMGLSASLGMLNRLDSALFFAPALVYVLYKRPTARTVGTLALGFLPLIAWELFSLFYYGFPFPNTAYAKLNTSLPALALARQGLVYYLDSLERDPITLLVIVAGLVLAVWRGNQRDRFFAAGVLLYLLYIIKIGGDFMSGRFFAAPLLAVALLSIRRFELMTRSLRVTVAIAAILLGFMAPYPTFLPHDENQPPYRESDLITGILDERGFYYQTTGLPIAIKNGWKLPESQGWVEHGLILRESDRSVVIENNIGFVGFYAGPTIHLLDIYALSDPLLARLPVSNLKKWRIGHFEREIPAGYIATLRTGENKLTDPALAAYYDKLALIIRGSLWSTERLQTIWKMNTGQYEALLETYQTQPNAP